MTDIERTVARAVDRLPRVQAWRRGAAFLIDISGAWLISALFAGRAGLIVQSILFLLSWLTLRVALVSKNQGQSLGRWALDMRVAEAQKGRVPDLQALLKREGSLGLCALLAVLSFSNPTLIWNGGILPLFIPLAIDAGVAVADSRYRQALHDRLAQTVIVQTRRGYSLDLKIKKLLAEVSLRVKR